MITTQSLWGLTGALTLMLIITIALAYRAYGIGQRAASDASGRQIDTLRKNLRAAQQQRDNIAEQLENEKRAAGNIISDLEAKNDELGIEQAGADILIKRLRQALSEAQGRADSLATTSISPGEVRLVREMSEKLQLAAAAMHATQQFKAAREAKELAQRGNRLAARLDGQHQEAAA